MHQIERRYVPAAEATLELEERSAAAPVIKGISPPWNSKSVDLGGFREVFAPEAFDRILGRHRNDPRGGVDVVALFNHDDNQVLGRTTAGTLELYKTKKGMAYSITPPDTTLGRDLLTLLRRGDISGASFAFSVQEGGERWSVDDDGKDLRTITEVAGLYDVSVVTRPAYPESSAALRSLAAWKATAVLALPPVVPAGRLVGEQRATTISIDFDRTFSSDPQLWGEFAAKSVSEGNTVVMISRRPDTPEDRETIMGTLGDYSSAFSQVLLVGPQTLKDDAAQAAGISVDVWVDDSPQYIRSQLELQRRRWSYAISAAGAKLLNMRLKTYAARIK